METQNATVIMVDATITAGVEKVWECWTNPEHVVGWNQASDDWHTTSATTDLRVGGSFSARMEAKDGSMGFDFAGVYDVLRTNEYIGCTIGDGRKVEVIFTPIGNTTKVTESFEAETMNSEDLQRSGWQAIMDSFKSYVESK